MTIPPEFYEVAMQWFREQNVQESQSRDEILESQQRAYNLCLKKIDGLIDMRAGGDLTDEEFKAKKSVLLQEKEKYAAMLAGTDKRVDHWLELAEDVFTFARDVRLRFETGDWDTKKQILQMLGSKFVLKDKKLDITLDDLLFEVPTIAKEAKKRSDALEPPTTLDNSGENGDSRPFSPALLRGQDSDLLRKLMGLPGKPFPTLPRYRPMPNVKLSLGNYTLF
jgi:hypothetical protein